MPAIHAHSPVSVLSRALFVMTTVSCSVAAAGEESRSGDNWRTEVDVGYVNQFESPLDSGGDFAAGRYFLRLSASRRLAEAWSVGVALGYGETDYDFTGSSGFGGLDPWDKVRQVSVSLPVRYRSSENWSFIAIPTLRYVEESGAEGSSQQLGLLAAGSYRVSDRLSIGPGFGVFSGLEESTDVFPILLIDWQITDQWSLETGRGLASSRGPGISLKWRPGSDWTFSLAGRYEKTRFRLDDAGIGAGGVGQDKALSLGLAAQYEPNPYLSFTVLGGMDFAGSLELEDRNGNLLAESDYDSAPFAGLLLNVKF